MDKNVSGVDLEELMKAREELDKEKGVETDPHMYSDYNPNRKNETEETNSVSLENNDYENITSHDDKNEKLESIDESSSLLQESNDESENSLSFANKSEEINQTENVESNVEASELSEENNETEADDSKDLSKYDVFAAFEVNEGNQTSVPKEEIHIDVEPASVEINTGDESNEQQTTEIEENMSSVDDLNNKSTDENADDKNESIDSKQQEVTNELDNIDMAAELEKAMASVDEILKNRNDKKIEVESQENNEQSIEDRDEQPIESVEEPAKQHEEQADEKTTEEIVPTAINIDVDAKLNNDAKVEEKQENFETVQNANIDTISAEEVDKELIDEPTEKNEDVADELIENSEPVKKVETEVADIASQNDKHEEIAAEKIEKKFDEKPIDVDSLMGDIDFKTAEKEQMDNFDTLEDMPVEQNSLENNFISTQVESPKTFVENKPAKIENEMYDTEAEVITDYSQLKSILQKELEESEKAALAKVEKPLDEKPKYSHINDFKFLNEIATDGFKNSHNFSYIIGKDEKGETVYGNFQEHFNLAVFGKNEQITNNFVNLMMLSLCLKNSYQDLNFVLLDADINSSFEIYNKSSYLFFNRIAKTNKEIMDTLIEVSKEIDDRYEKLAGLGVKNVEQYNQIAKENGFSTMPNVIVVFNNYTKCSQATYSDKINACLYQILKFGRIVGFNALVVAKLPIAMSQINYSLSSRINFKYDDDSTFTLGADGADSLPDDNDALFLNITSNEVKHIKTASITETELDLIISDLEE